MLSVTAADLWTVAQTAWGEARSEGVGGMAAVVEVIRNRQQLARRWQGWSLQDVCHAPAQFSVWNLTDPNRRLLEALTLTDRVFCEALHVAIEVLRGARPATVGAATHYYADTMARPPAWARGHTPVAHLGHHLFFEGIA